MEMSPELAVVSDDLLAQLGPAAPHLSELIWDYEERIDRLIAAMKYSEEDEDLLFSEADYKAEQDQDQRIFAGLKASTPSPSSKGSSTRYFGQGKKADAVAEPYVQMPSNQDMSDDDSDDGGCDETVIADEVHAAAQSAISSAFGLARPSNRLSKKSEFSLDYIDSKASFSTKNRMRNANDMASAVANVAKIVQGLDENLSDSFEESVQRKKETDYLNRKRGDKPKELPLSDRTNR